MKTLVTLQVALTEADISGSHTILKTRHISVNSNMDITAEFKS
jgi:hypothetical protein